MRAASAATLAILAAGEYMVAELYDLTLVTGQTYHFTSFDVPVTCGIYANGSVGSANTYQTGLTIVRDTLTLKSTLESGTMKLMIAPQWDAPGGPPTVGGYQIQQAATYGYLDGATLLFSKIFLNPPASAATPLTVSQGAVKWFLGTVQQTDADRFSVTLSIEDYISTLANQQMPRALFQVGCFHQIYDGGCTLLAANFTATGTVTSVGDAAHFTASAMTQVSGYFKLGVLKFTSGANSGVSGPVSSFTQSSGGAFAMTNPFPVAPAVGDTFSVYPGCDLQYSTCTNTSTAVGPPFNNGAHFSGQPFVPVAETILDGGTDTPPAQTRGSTAGQIVGSQPSAQQTYFPFQI